MVFYFEIGESECGQRNLLMLTHVACRSPFANHAESDSPEQAATYKKLYE